MPPSATAAPATDQPAPQIPLSPHKPAPYRGPSRAEVLALCKQYLTPALLTYYKEPLMIVEGKMLYVWDENGRPTGIILRVHASGDQASS